MVLRLTIGCTGHTTEGGTLTLAARVVKPTPLYVVAPQASTRCKKKDGISNSSWHLILELARLRPGLFLPRASVLLQLGHSLPELGEALLSGLEGCRRGLESSTQLRNLIVNDKFSDCRRSSCIEGEVKLAKRGFVRAPMPHRRHHSRRNLRITPL